MHYDTLLFDLDGTLLDFRQTEALSLAELFAAHGIPFTASLHRDYMEINDALWAQFRKAADEFFNARQADRDQISTSEKENLAKKEELLKKAEALVPVADEAAAKKARQALGAIQDEWDQIGYVPRDDMRRIEGRLDAVDKQIKAVEDAAWKKTDPEADARKSSFEEQLTAQLAELDEKIAAESDPKKKAKLEAEKATKEQWLNAIK